MRLCFPCSSFQDASLSKLAKCQEHVENIVKNVSATPITGRKSVSGYHAGSHQCYCCGRDKSGRDWAECCVWTSDSYSDDLILFSVSVLHSLTFLSNPFSQSHCLSKACVVWPASLGDKMKFILFMATAAALFLMYVLSSMSEVYIRP